MGAWRGRGVAGPREWPAGRAGPGHEPASWRDSLRGGEVLFPLRDHAQHDAMRGREVLPRYPLHVGGRHAAIALEVLLEIVGRADEVLVLVQLVRLAEYRLHR